MAKQYGLKLEIVGGIIVYGTAASAKLAHARVVDVDWHSRMQEYLNSIQAEVREDHYLERGLFFGEKKIFRMLDAMRCGLYRTWDKKIPLEDFLFEVKDLLDLASDWLLKDKKSVMQEYFLPVIRAHFRELDGLSDEDIITLNF